MVVCIHQQDVKMQSAKNIGKKSCDESTCPKKLR